MRVSNVHTFKKAKEASRCPRTSKHSIRCFKYTKIVLTYDHMPVFYLYVYTHELVTRSFIISTEKQSLLGTTNLRLE